MAQQNHTIMGSPFLPERSCRDEGQVDSVSSTQQNIDHAQAEVDAVCQQQEDKENVRSLLHNPC